MSGAVLVESSRESCQCADCVSLCRTVPGFFKPGEAEDAAKLLGLAFPVFVRTMLDVVEIPDTTATGLRPKLSDCRRDAARLNWLDVSGLEHARLSAVSDAWFTRDSNSVREAIDAAMSASLERPDHA